MRLIDADAFESDIRKRYCAECDNYNGVKCKACWVDDMLGEIEDAPTVDAVPVIRCKDCENHRNRTNMCDIWHSHTRSDGYCHRAKAKKISQ